MYIFCSEKSSHLKQAKKFTTSGKMVNSLPIMIFCMFLSSADLFLSKSVFLQIFV